MAVPATTAIRLTAVVGPGMTLVTAHDTTKAAAAPKTVGGMARPAIPRTLRNRARPAAPEYHSSARIVA